MSAAGAAAAVAVVAYRYWMTDSEQEEREPLTEGYDPLNLCFTYLQYYRSLYYRIMIRLFGWDLWE